MTQWELHPEAVAQALDGTSAAFQALQGAITPSQLDTIFTGAAQGGELTAAVPAILQQILHEQELRMRGIADRIGAGITGVGNAALALQSGSEDMASVLHAEMRAVAESGDYRYFTVYDGDSDDLGEPIP